MLVIERYFHFDLSSLRNLSRKHLTVGFLQIKDSVLWVLCFLLFLSTDYHLNIIYSVFRKFKKLKGQKAFYRLFSCSYWKLIKENNNNKIYTFKSSKTHFELKHEWQKYCYKITFCFCSFSFFFALIQTVCSSDRLFYHFFSNMLTACQGPDVPTFGEQWDLIDCNCSWFSRRLAFCLEQR